jgi:hypothetical protein
MLGKAGVVVIAALVVGGAALAGPRGGGHASRGAARSSVSHTSRNVSGSVNRSANVNRNTNVNRNVNRDINVDRDIDVDRRYGGWGDGCCYHPVARTAAVTAAAATTAAVVGSAVYSIPESCSAVTVSGLTYQQCGSTWYQPEFSGSSVTYVVVNAPR